MNKKLSCQDIVELVTDYIENALSAEERRRFERHLTSCPGCVTYVDRSARRSASPAGCRARTQQGD